MAIAPDKRFRKKQGFENSLFGRLGGSLKQSVHPAVRCMKKRHGGFRQLREMLAGRKGNGYVSAAMSKKRARPCKAIPSPPGQPSELQYIQRRIGRQQHDDAALFRCSGEHGGFRTDTVQPFLQKMAHGTASQQAVFRFAEIGEHQRAYRKGLPTALRYSGGRTNAPLRWKQDMPRPAPTLPCMNSREAEAQASV